MRLINTAIFWGRLAEAETGMVDTSQCARVCPCVAFSMRQFDWLIIAFGAGAFITAAALIIALTCS